MADEGLIAIRRKPLTVPGEILLRSTPDRQGFVNLSSKSPKASGSEKHAHALRHLFHPAPGQPADAAGRELAWPRPVQRRRRCRRRR